MINSKLNEDTAKADVESEIDVKPEDQPEIQPEIQPDNTARPPGDEQTLPPERRDPFGPQLTPQTDDRTKELAPDDTFPGSGPLHPDDY